MLRGQHRVVKPEQVERIAVDRPDVGTTLDDRFDDSPWRDERPRQFGIKDSTSRRIEPEQVIKRLSRVIPLMRQRLERLATGPDPGLAVATAVRVAVSHYLVRSDDDADFLAQLRHAVRVKHQTS